jgi:tRNA A-37 threonylcarbamoyl transferase component Bud32
MASSLARDVSGVRWFLSDHLRERVPGDSASFGAWLGAGEVHIIKDGPHRAVYRVRGSGLDVYVKHYRPLGFRARLREWLRPVKAKREFELGRILQARGVPTPVPLAWGTCPASSWLVTETVQDAQTVLAFLEEGRSHSADCSARSRQIFARALGAFVARLHTAGVLHADLHPGNILLRRPPGGDPEFALIDLHAMRLRSPVRWVDCRRNLVIFNRYFLLRATRSDRRRFWAAYTAALGAIAPQPSGQAARQVEETTWESNRQFWRARDRRCLASNRYYVRVHCGDLRGFAVRDLDPARLKALLADPDAVLSRAGVRILKQSLSSTVAELTWPGVGTCGRVVLKRFQVRDRSDPWLGLVRRSAPLRSWVFGHGLRERCLPTARPLAVFHRHRRGLRRDGYLLTEKIDGATDLHEWVRRLSAAPVRERTACLRLRAKALARLLRELHHRGLTHRDLKAANLLTPLDWHDHRFWLIDLVGVRRDDRPSDDRRAQNLARLHASFRDHALVTRAEKLRFLRGYLEWGLRGKTGWKAWWHAIAAATRAKVARNLRRGRPLA